MEKRKPIIVFVVLVLAFAMVLPVCGLISYSTEIVTTTVSEETPTTVYVSIFPSRPFLTVGQKNSLNRFRPMIILGFGTPITLPSPLSRVLDWSQLMLLGQQLYIYIILQLITLLLEENALWM